MVKVDRRIRWHYTTTVLRLRIGARLTKYRNCKFHNFARTISRHADGISRYSVPPSAGGPLLPLGSAIAPQWVRAEQGRRTHFCAIHSPESANLLKVSRTCTRRPYTPEVGSVAIEHSIVFDIQMC